MTLVDGRFRQNRLWRNYMSALKKNKLQDAINAVREVFYDAIASRIQYSSKTYADIGAELGCSEQTVYQVARLRHLRRTTQEATANKEQTMPEPAVESSDSGGGNE